MSADYIYAGAELDLFARAANWKRYFASHLRPYLRGDILEVGAGIGATTRLLCRGSEASWTCLEPDRELAGRLTASVQENPLALQPSVIVGTTAGLAAGQLFDAILYVDVLEHIEHDAEEVRSAAEHLKPGGALIVLAPAHQRLFTPFDESIGHFRRYDKAMMRRLQAPNITLDRLIYLDSVGLLASLGNTLVLRASMPTPQQIQIWDRLMVPVSRMLDPLLGYRLGKSIVGVWRRH